MEFGRVGAETLLEEPELSVVSEVSVVEDRESVSEMAVAINPNFGIQQTSCIIELRFEPELLLETSWRELARELTAPSTPALKRTRGHQKKRKCVDGFTLLLALNES